MRTARSSSRRGGGWEVGGSASVHDGIHTPWVWAWRPPLGVDLETPLGVGLETPPGCGPEDPP